jgi:hypothetical protein
MHIRSVFEKLPALSARLLDRDGEYSTGLRSGSPRSFISVIRIF